MNDALDFFKMRRCVEDLHPDPKFPGCVYSEMKMCLAPCFKGCTDDEYRAEVVRVEDFLDYARRIAEAANVHGARPRLANTGLRRGRRPARAPRKAGARAPADAGFGSAPRPIARAHRPAVAAAGKRRTVSRRCRRASPARLTFPISGAEHTKSQSMEARIQAALAAFPAAQPSSAIERMEHLAILKRWCYRGTRKGEIFFADAKGELPMRRIVRGIGRVYKGRSARDEPARNNAGTVARIAIKYLQSNEEGTMPKKKKTTSKKRASAQEGHAEKSQPGFRISRQIRARTSPLPARRRRRPRRLRCRHGRLARPTGRRQSCELPPHRLDAARAYAHRAMGHPRVQPPPEAQVPAKWPEGYWPESESPPSEKAWTSSMADFRKDLRTMQQLVSNPKTNLYAKLPWGDGQTILREALLVADHNAYHLGQLVMLRKCMGI